MVAFHPHLRFHYCIICSTREPPPVLIDFLDESGQQQLFDDAVAHYKRALALNASLVEQALEEVG